VRVNPRTLIVLGIVVVAVVGFIVLRDRLPNDATSLEVGQCFDVPTEQGSISDVQRHPCNEPHTGEVVGQGNLTGDGNASYPLDSEIRSFATDLCVAAFNTYTGKDVNTDAELTVGWFYPTTSSWSSGDREVTCYASRIDEGQLTSTVKAA
jgi:hypothetical protein